MQKKLEKGKLLDENGHLNQSGYATNLVKEYLRSDIKAKCFKIKEWDYYIVTNEKYAVAFTVADNSYMALISASFLDFETKEYTTTSVMKFFTFGKLQMPSTSVVGDIKYEDKRVKMSFKNDGTRRLLECEFKKFNKGGETLISKIETELDPQDSMVIATPFDKNKKAFYYNQKINTIKASGFAKIGEKHYEFNKDNSLATLDWGRGVWTYENTWYWGSLSAYVDGALVGFNIGYGFGNTSNASENMIFYNGVAHKTQEVTFNIPKINGKEDYMKPWTFTSSDNRINLSFNPIIDRYDNTDLLVLLSNQHQVFGYFSGTLVLDDKTVITIDNKVGFAEKVHNKW